MFLHYIVKLKGRLIVEIPLQENNKVDTFCKYETFSLIVNIIWLQQIIHLANIFYVLLFNIVLEINNFNVM